jgi:hypothetical protein
VIEAIKNNAKQWLTFAAQLENTTATLQLQCNQQSLLNQDDVNSAEVLTQRSINFCDKLKKEAKHWLDPKSNNLERLEID